MYCSFRRASLPCDPVSTCAALQDRSHPALLHSAMQIGRYGDYSFLACDPQLILQSHGYQVNLTGQINERIIGDPFECLQKLLSRFSISLSDVPFPFSGGAIGYLSYDLGRQLETIPVHAVEDIQIPEMYLCFYDAILIFCHASQDVYVMGLDESGHSRASENAEALIKKVLNGVIAPRELGNASKGPLIQNFTHEEYLTALKQTIEYIYAGDIFQANLSQRFAVSLKIKPWELYQRLMTFNPAPFAAYLGFDDLQVVSASPERFLKVNDGRVETRPIKGTLPRGKTLQEDIALATDLLGSEKDNAELTMIIDLERNDLGRVCQFGSIKVPELVSLESYPTVHHLVATVEGKLTRDNTAIDLLRASFPGGSITGAPKIRAMEIIEELEPTRRGVYTGSIGWLGYDGSIDLNIAIRTITCHNGYAHFQVGGGIVADSVPEREYMETLYKGRALANALDVKLPGLED